MRRWIVAAVMALGLMLTPLALDGDDHQTAAQMTVEEQMALKRWTGCPPYC